ncbi:MAG: recombinase family protein, partial [Rhizomicrobium sp.]
MSTKRPLRCAIYTRKSTEEGLEQDFNSLDAQREACGAYVLSQKAEGWQALKDKYDDGGFSGGTLERPALKRLLKSIEDGSVDVVVVYKIDRLSRSLMDFTRLVEVFDRKGVTFVSVTQSFNTTTSMGRLTLNVLLSFAQFEREVTGERIRDKFAASKKKGLWMGGNPPLGYDVVSRKLAVNDVEAETVRMIFQRYLDLGCVRLLCEDLQKLGIVSKQRRLTSGRVYGGRPFCRSTLYLILNNRTYLGEVTHKGATYRGEHKPIVPRPLFDAVQDRLAELAPPLTGRARAAQDALLAGLVFDETEAAMLPAYSVKNTNLRYRYYVSRPALKGERSTAAIHRIPAPPFEAFITRTLERLGLPGCLDPARLKSLVRRIEVLSKSIVVRLDRANSLSLWRTQDQTAHALRDKEVLAIRRRSLCAGEIIADDGDTLTATLPVRARFRGGAAAQLPSIGDNHDERQPDTTLLKAIARAYRWRALLERGEVRSIEELATRFGLDRGHAGLTLNLAFLSPAITRAIVRGEQPPGLRLTHLLNAHIPADWFAQETLVRQLANEIILGAR